MLKTLKQINYSSDQALYLKETKLPEPSLHNYSLRCRCGTLWFLDLVNQQKFERVVFCFCFNFASSVGVQTVAFTGDSLYPCV